MVGWLDVGMGWLDGLAGRLDRRGVAGRKGRSRRQTKRSSMVSVLTWSAFPFPRFALSQTLKCRRCLRKVGLPRQHRTVRKANQIGFAFFLVLFGRHPSKSGLNEQGPRQHILLHVPNPVRHPHIRIQNQNAHECKNLV